GVFLWDVATGKKLLTLDTDKAGQPATEAGGAALAFAPDGKLLATASYDRTLVLWSAATGKAVRTLGDGQPSFDAVAFSPDGRSLAAVSEGGAFVLWEVGTGKACLEVPRVDNQLFAFSFAPDGRTVAVSGLDGKVRLLDAADGAVVQTLGGHQ